MTRPTSSNTHTHTHTHRHEHVLAHVGIVTANLGTVHGHVTTVQILELFVFVIG